MQSISTKTGDKGESGLANGKRVAKTNQTFEVLGELDELNSWLGLIVVKLEDTFHDHRHFLLKVQDTLFYIGAEIAQSPKAKLTNDQLQELEQVADKLQQEMREGWITKFLLPGGTELGAWLDIARTVCRRVERHAWVLNDTTPISPTVLKYLNRLSDYLYLVRCFVNQAVEYAEKPFEATYKENL